MFTVTATSSGLSNYDKNKGGIKVTERECPRREEVEVDGWDKQDFHPGDCYVSSVKPKLNFNLF